MIRIVKEIGYGLANLHLRGEPTETARGRVPDDPRWDYAAHRARWTTEERTLADFVGWCKVDEEALRAMAKQEGGDEGHSDLSHFLLLRALEDRLERNQRWYSHDAVTWSNEGGLPNVLLFRSATCPDWKRHNDTIDFYENHVERRASVTFPSVDGIYPYVGRMKRFRFDVNYPSSERLDDVIRACFLGEERPKEGAPIVTMSREVYDRILLRLRGHGIRHAEGMAEHFRDDWRPQVPLSILAQIAFLGTFPDPLGHHGVVNSLRPMIYTYWS